MRRLLIAIVIAALCGTVSTPFAEDLPPISLGSGQSSTQTANGQIVEITVTGPLQATIYFETVQDHEVSGLAVRTSSGTSSGTVLIRWVNKQREQSFDLSAGVPSQQFSLEGGDGDKRVPSNEIQ